MGNDRHVEGGPRDEDLLVLLEDLAEKHGRMEASKLLGVNNKTLASNLNSGQLTKRVREALELYQLRDVVELERDEAPDVEEDSSLSEVVEALSRQLSDLKERVDRVESDGDAQPPGNGDAKETGTGRPLQGVISIDPLAAEDWGEAAELVVEWRALRLAHPDRDDGSLNWAGDEVRKLEVELALLETHGLTLPPEVLPFSKFKRADAIRWRREALRTAVARRRARRFLRVLTLGLRR